jgi:hypothetical protein
MKTCIAVLALIVLLTPTSSSDELDAEAEKEAVIIPQWFAHFSNRISAEGS